MGNIVAYFDMDRTILSDSSGILYMRYLWRQGDVSRLASVVQTGLFQLPCCGGQAGCNYGR